MIAFFIVFVVSFSLSLLLTPLAAKLGRRWGIVAVPDERRHHKGIIPRSGGISLFISFMAALICIAFMPVEWMPPAPEGPDPNEITRLVGMLLGLAFLFVVGLVDDSKELSARSLLASHIVASLIAIVFLIFIEVVNNPFTDQQLWIPWPLPLFITIFWITGMMSTVNFLDGLDGLAAGVTAIVCVILTIHMIREQQYSVALLPLALLGTVLGFLPFNVAPARMFMGSGAYLLGYALGALSIIAGARVATMLIVLLIPISDVAWQAYTRWRSGKDIGHGDRGHLHYRLLDMGLSQRQVVGLYYLVTAVLGSMALLISHRFYKLIAIIILMLFSGLLLVFTTHRSRRR